MGDGTQIVTGITIINSLNGFQAISLTNMTTSAETIITAGSKVEIAGAFFHFPTDSTPQASTWTVIATGNTAYITLTPSGTAGSQILTAKWSDTTPEWSDSKQGWYLTAASVIRYIGGCYKETSDASYESKFLMDNSQRRGLMQEYYATGGTIINSAVLQQVVEIGTWNMDTTASKIIDFDVPVKQIISFAGSVRNDTGTLRYPISPGRREAATSASLYITLSSHNQITMSRHGGGFFDDSDFTAAGINRGWVIVTYVAHDVL